MAGIASVEQVHQMMVNHNNDVAFRKYQSTVDELKQEKQADRDVVSRRLRNNELLYTQARYDESVAKQWRDVFRISLGIYLVILTGMMIYPNSVNYWPLVYLGYVTLIFLVYLGTRYTIGQRSRLNFDHIHFPGPNKE